MSLTDTRPLTGRRVFSYCFIYKQVLNEGMEKTQEQEPYDFSTWSSERLEERLNKILDHCMLIKPTPERSATLAREISQIEFELEYRKKSTVLVQD